VGSADPQDSLTQSMDTAVKHYSSLFRLPSYRKVVLFLALICLVGAMVSTAAVFRSYEGLAYGVLLGFSLFLVTIFADYATSGLVLKRDPIYDLRRTATLSLFCWVIWFFFILVGTMVDVIYGVPWWVRFCLVGFSAVLIFRLVVFNSTSFFDYRRLTLASLLSPCLTMIPFIAVWNAVAAGYPITLQRLLFFIFSPFLAVVASYLFLYLINHVTDEIPDIPALSLFKAFLLSWIVDLNAPFEGFLERLSEKQDVEVDLFRFDSRERKVCMAVPSVHPGPFKNIGSSILPYLIKEALEKKYGCVACVPHGLFGHELDLVSQAQNQRVVSNVVQAMNFPTSGVVASPFATASDGLASACCQIFDNAAFLSVTLAPKTTEDIPQELGLFIRKRARELGLAYCTVVNAHNSIDNMNGMPVALDSLRAVATSCLEKAVSASRLAFEVAAYSILPRFSLKDGMGSGGITVVAIRVGGQTAAYVVIDGNNIVSGLREKILDALESVGIATGEVFTTDTHSVSGIVLGRRGYHPVGEAIDHEKLIAYIKQATLAAVADLESAKVGYRSISISDVKVIGKERLENLSHLTDKGLQVAKRAIVPISLFSGLLLMLFLLLA
jgi:putative membrane protein